MVVGMAAFEPAPDGCVPEVGAEMRRARTAPPADEGRRRRAPRPLRIRRDAGSSHRLGRGRPPPRRRSSTSSTSSPTTRAG